MVTETALPFSLCKSKILFFSAMVLLRHIYKLCHWLDSSLPLDIMLFSAIAFWSLVTWFRCDFFIMSLDDFWHIIHATVADFNCIAVENFVKLVASWKMFCYQLKECLCNVNKPFQNWVGILPLVEMKFWKQFFIDFLND